MSTEAAQPAPDTAAPRHPGGRKPKTDVYRPKVCPSKHRGTIRLAGRYATASPYFERVRWRCVPADAVVPEHRFATLLAARHPRPTHPHSGEACETCEHIYAGHEGPKTPRRHHYSIAEAVDVLIGIGQGESLRERSAQARLAGLRLWDGWTAPERLKARGNGAHPKRVERDDKTADVDDGQDDEAPADDEADATPDEEPGPAENRYQISAFVPKAPTRINEPIYETFDQEPWRVPLPDPSAPSSFPATLRELIDDDEDELERWASLRAAQTELPPGALVIPDLDEPLPVITPDLPEIDRFGFGVPPDFLAELGLEGEPEPIDYQPEEMPERRDWATRPWGDSSRAHAHSRAREDDEDEWDPDAAEHPGADMLGTTTAGVSRQPALACDYVDLFAPVVLAPLLPLPWPEVAVIDSLPIRRGKWLNGRRIARGQKTGEIVAVIDATNPARQVPVHICILGGKDRWSWIELFRRFEGAPRYLTTDRDAGLTAAVARHWPDTLHYYCEGHLLRNMRDAATADKELEGSLKARNPVWSAMDKAQHSPKRWDELKAAVEKHVPAGKRGLRTWIDANEDLVLSQMTLRERNRGVVRGTGAAESVLVEVRRLLARRAAGFRNRKRLDLVLGLVCAQMAHRADPKAYAGRIREFLEAQGGTTGMERKTWARMRDRWIGTCSIDAMLRDADLRSALEADEEEREYNAIKRVARNEEHAVERIVEGLPDDYHIRRRNDLGRKARRAIPLRKSLADYPELLAQWHPTKNPGVDPLTLKAGSGITYWWICREHEAGTELYPGHVHEWPSRMANRTRDGAGCRYCMRRAVCPGNSIRATHPKIADAWHPTKNGDRRPDDYISGSQVEAWFTCDRHPDYHSMIREACKFGCPECGRERGKAKRQAAKTAARKTRRDLAREARRLQTERDVGAGSGAAKGERGLAAS